MIYSFICSKCGNKVQKNVPVSEIKNIIVKCDNCGTDMRRDWKASIRVGLGDSASEIHETSFVRESLKTRPTGKSKVFY